MWVRKRIDIRYGALVRALGMCVRPPSPEASEARIANCFESDQTFPCLSVRTGFDCLLQAKAWETKSEILFSCLTIGDMPKIVQEHGLTPIGIPVDAETLCPDVADIESQITDQTRAIVIAHLMGGRCDLEPIAKLARQHGIMLIEDCAQVFTGTDYQGSDLADVSMFSFGAIKTHTAISGAVLFVRDEELRKQMRAVYDPLRLQSRSFFARRVAKYLGIITISRRPIAAMIVALCKLLGRDYDRMASQMAKGFAGSGFFYQIRKRPSASLLAFLAHRIERFDPDKIKTRVARANHLIDLLLEADARFAPIGYRAVEPTHWVIAIPVKNRQELTKALWKHGFDATTRSSLIVVPGRPPETTDRSEAILEHAVFLPVDPPMPLREIERMARIIIATGQPIDRPVAQHDRSAYACKPARKQVMAPVSSSSFKT